MLIAESLLTFCARAYCLTPRLMGPVPRKLLVSPPLFLRLNQFGRIAEARVGSPCSPILEILVLKERVIIRLTYYKSLNK